MAENPLHSQPSVDGGSQHSVDRLSAFRMSSDRASMQQHQKKHPSGSFSMPVFRDFRDDHPYPVIEKIDKLVSRLSGHGHDPEVEELKKQYPNDIEMVDSEDGEFKYSHGLTSQEADVLLKKYGRNELPEKTIPKWYIFVSLLWQPMPVMIWLAIIVEAAIQSWVDMAVLLFIQFSNASIGYYEVTKAGDAVAALKKSLKPTATVKRDGKFINIDAALLVPGDLVLLASGSAVPADCRINEGEIEVDEAALTGESLPVTMVKGSSAKMGSTVARGETEGTVEFTGIDTFFGKTAALLQNSGEVSNFQQLLVNIMLVLVAISSVLCLIVFIFLLTKVSFIESLSFTVVLMVASIPLAMEIVTTTTLAVGSKEMSHDGAIVTRLAAIEDMAAMSILCSDKTGTLTMNKMVIQEETPVYRPGENQYSLLRYAAMAAKWKEPPRDALDTLTLNAVDMPSMDAVEQLAFMPFDPIVKRTEGTVRDIKTGEVFRTTKGAPQIILKLVAATMSDPKEIEHITHLVDSDVTKYGLRGIRTLAVAKGSEDGKKWEFLGLLTFLDPPRPDTKETIENAVKYGVAVKMITGDQLLIAKETARVLGMGDYIRTSNCLPLLDEETKKKPADLAKNYGDVCLACDGFAQVFPEHKYLIVECLRDLGYKTGMTGDGVNDAPALKVADVGVAVQGATDAARAAADIVLTQPGLSTIVHGIVIARCIFARIRSFLTYRIAATLQLLVFFFIAVLSLKPRDFMPDDWETDNDFPDSKEWPEFFHMPVLLLMLITLLNDGTLIAIGYDRVFPREMPEKWNLPALYLISSVMAFVAMVSSIILLYFLLDSWTDGGVLNGIGLPGLSYGQVTTSIYLKVSISDFLTLFSARTGDKFFWSSRPSWILLGAGSFSLMCSTIIAITWPSGESDKVPTEGLGRRKPVELFVYIWLYCIFWWFVQDTAKVYTFRLLEKYNWFNYNETGKLTLSEKTLEYIRLNKQKDMEEDLKAKRHH